MTDEFAVHAVLHEYPASLQLESVRGLGNALGFSGAQFWRIQSTAGDLCLRQWPSEHPSASHLRKIHAVLLHVAEGGLACVPAPIRTRHGSSFVELADHLWELGPWLPGEASYHREPSTGKLENAMQTLARFHVLAATCRGWVTDAQKPPGIEQRQAMLRWLLEDGLRLIRSALGKQSRDEYAERAERLLVAFPLLAPAVAAQLTESASLVLPCQPCIRDIWHDHVLFSGDEVTGLVDFGAMRSDNVACDIARLLGSLVGDDPPQRLTGLGAYQRIRPLAEDELRLIHVYDLSAVLLSGFNWLRWIYLENRRFEQIGAVLARLDECLARLEHHARMQPAAK